LTIHTLTHDGSTARIAAQHGFNCFEFLANVGGRTVSVVDSKPGFAETGASPSGSGIPILFPYPNRIRKGTYDWDGTTYELPEGVVAYNKDNAIHGFCLDRPWRVTDSGPNVVTGEFQLSVDAPDRRPLWPADFVLAARYELRGPVLRCDFVVTNPGETPLPWGLGTHPYFTLPLGAEGALANCLVQAPAAEEWVLVDCLPTGERRPVTPGRDLREGARFTDLTFDHVLTGLPADAAVIETKLLDELAGLELVQRTDGSFRELVVYTPPNRPAICLEPYTCVTDAINLEQRGIDAGLRVLGPGEEYRGWVEIGVGPILA
jgi:aldose 1-epimerase